MHQLPLWDFVASSGVKFTFYFTLTRWEAQHVGLAAGRHAVNSRRVFEFYWIDPRLLNPQPNFYTEHLKRVTENFYNEMHATSLREHNISTLWRRNFLLKF